MNVFIGTLRQHLRIVRSYAAAMLLVVATFLQVLYYGYIEHRMAQAIGYLAAVWLGAFVTDLVVGLHPRPAVGFPIKHTVGKEIALLLTCLSLGFVFLSVRFGPLWTRLHGIPRLGVVSLIVFVYPMALALIYLLYLRYKPSELGVNLHYWYLPLFILLIVGSITFAVAPEKSHWHNELKELGLPGVLFIGLVCSALSEEFVRMLLQTRLGMALHNKGLGFVLASFIWAVLHSPVALQGSHAGFLHRLVAVGTIVPMGLLWGYLTHRSKSLLPAVLVHGLNFWGLQNL